MCQSASSGMDIPPIESIAESVELANEGVFEAKIEGRNPGQASAPEDLTSAATAAGFVTGAIMLCLPHYS